MKKKTLTEAANHWMNESDIDNQVEKWGEIFDAIQSTYGLDQLSFDSEYEDELWAVANAITTLATKVKGDVEELDMNTLDNGEEDVEGADGSDYTGNDNF